jgi:hypothetical protein
MRRLAALVLAAATTLSPSVGAGPSSSPVAGPGETRSHYLTSVDTTVLARTGTADATDAAAQGLTEAMVVLDAGSPAAPDGTVRLPDTRVHAKPGDVAKGVEAYGRAWLAAKGPALVLVVGTTNYGQYATGQHAAAWAHLVEEVAGVLPGIDVRGGLDAEQEYNTALVTRAWVEAYDASGTRPYVDFGSCTCPPAPSTPANGWTLEDVYAVAVGNGAALVLPEIYATQGGNARAWARVVAYAQQQHPDAPIHVVGALTELGACVGPPKRSCPGIDNPPAQAWGQLMSTLPTTAGLRYSTDISYLPQPGHRHGRAVLRQPLVLALAVLVLGVASTALLGLRRGWFSRRSRRRRRSR